MEKRIPHLLLLLTLVAICSPSGNGQESAPPKFRHQLDVTVRMRDGVKLATDIFLPGQGYKFPVILIRTPYGKRGEQEDGLFYVEHGYALAVQDTRGRYESDGEWYAFRNEANDGFDTIEWAAKQPWSNGKVVTMGASYFAIDQWLAATQASPHLAAMIVFICPSDLYRNAIHPGGAFLLGTALTWAMENGRHTNLSDELRFVSWPEAMLHLPVDTAAEAAGFDPAFYRDWVEHSTRDDYWRGLGWDGVYSRLAVPVFQIGGWFDIFQEGTIENFEKTAGEAPREVRGAERLIVGPWAHGAFEQKVGDVDFGKDSVVIFRFRLLRWLDHYVRGQANGAENDPAVEAFAMGANQWRKGTEWPPADAKPQRWFFHSSGKANSSGGDGMLSAEMPAEEPPDRFVYDPASPAPTTGGGTCCDPSLLPWGPKDQRAVEARSDVLVYSTPPLEGDLEVAGPVLVHLFASSDAKDTDWTAKLVDVSPDGFAMNLTDGILRARFRRSFERSELLEPGKAYEFQVNAGNTLNVFRKGHRMRLEISSSNFPRFSRNTNTGNVPEKDSSFITARQTVYHDRARPSSLELRIREKE